MKSCVVCGDDVATLSETPLCSFDCKETWICEDFVHKEPPYNCPACSSEFSTVGTLVDHVKKSNGMHKNYSFEVSDFTFRSEMCELCGDPFVPNNGNANRFCSKRCEGIYRRKSVQDLRNHKSYQTWKKRMKSNADSCNDCGECSDLHLHHIEPVSDSPERIMDKDNVVVVCAECHVSRHDGDDRVQRLLRSRYVDN